MRNPTADVSPRFELRSGPVGIHRLGRGEQDDDGANNSKDMPEIDDEEDADKADTIEIEVKTGKEPRKRALQHVVTKQESEKVTKWMIEVQEENDQRVLFARLVRNFSSCFRVSIKSNSTKPSRWWRSRGDIFTKDKEDYNTICNTQLNICSIVRLKAKTGRGPKIAPWIL
ncbi:hypothetical protein AXG93_2852s1430 [Marchantia polymorpha subsp. ruderalis]|uniref:Uncharacterized protein n=1 Tax=Marchantia polymorpha subsp. ruderalis TaxID=1480154 RepID=A0A176WKN2_MARPO|nr:hypothetical protein AXG93_2852s1430 [Marchantia polymorpha subsp. ruderalis]